MGGLDLVEEEEGFSDRHVQLGRPTSEPGGETEQSI